MFGLGSVLHQFLNDSHGPSSSVSKMDECEICCQPYTVSNKEPNTVSCPRKHKFCIDCFRTYAEEMIDGMGKAELQCMAQDCGLAYAEDVLNRWLDRKHLKRLRENGKGEIRCTCDCKNCGWKIKRDAMSKADRERMEREEHLTSQAVRRCPKCAKPIVKEGGCNHIVCPSCSTHMCYVCERQVTGFIYDHRCFREDSDPPIQGQGRYGDWFYYAEPDGNAAIQRAHTANTSRHTSWALPFFSVGGQSVAIDREPTTSSNRFDYEQVSLADFAHFGSSGKAPSTSTRREPTKVETRLKAAVGMTKFKFNATPKVDLKTAPTLSLR